MLDVFSTKQLATDSANFARQIAYVGAMNTAASAAEQAALSAFTSEHNISGATPSDVLAQHAQQAHDAVENSARESGEPVYVKAFVCQVHGDRQGLFTRSDVALHSPLADQDESWFERIADPSQCHRQRHATCYGHNPGNRGCMWHEHITYVSWERLELSHYRKVQNPRRYVVDGPACCE